MSFFFFNKLSLFHTYLTHVPYHFINKKTSCNECYLLSLKPMKSRHLRKFPVYKYSGRAHMGRECDACFLVNRTLNQTCNTIIFTSVLSCCQWHDPFPPQTSSPRMKQTLKQPIRHVGSDLLSSSQTCSGGSQVMNKVKSSFSICIFTSLVSVKITGS